MAEPPESRDPDRPVPNGDDPTRADGWVRPSDRRRGRPEPPDPTVETSGETTGDAVRTGAVTGSAVRAARRKRAKRRSRRRVIAGIGALAVVLAVIAGIAATSGGSASKVATHARRILPTTTTAPGPPPPSLIATTKVPSLQVYDQPNGKVVTTLSDKTSYGLPRTLLATSEEPGWLQVLLPQQPNDTQGWVRTTDVTESATAYAMKVSLGAHHLWLTKAGAPVVDTAVVIGAPKTPTPTGVFYVTDPVNLTTQPNGPYGAYALGLSGYSNTLASFDGGPPQIAVHGTPHPDQVGQDLSNGCVRIPSPIILQIAGVVPLGTPVTIVA